MTDTDIRGHLLRSYRSPDGYADMTRWWRDPEIVRRLGPALAGLHIDQHPTAVAGVESHGLFLAGFAAVHLGVGVIEVRKGEPRANIRDQFWIRHAPPDYLDRNLVLRVRRTHLTERDRILFVDDWIETGAQAMTAARLVEAAGAEWLGGAVIVDSAEWAVRRRLNIRSLLHVRELPD